MNDDRLRDDESHEALLAGMGLEPLGTWWLPGIRKAATARRMLAAADAAGEPAVGPDRAAGLVLGGGREFLLAFAGLHAPRGRMGGAWRRVRILADDPVRALAGLLDGADPDPRGMLLSAVDGETFAGVVPGAGGAPRLLALTGVGARIDEAARAAARESAEESAAVWDAFLAEPDPAPAVIEAWTDGLGANRGTPEGIRLELFRRSPRQLWRLPPDEFMETVLGYSDPKARLRAVEGNPHLTPADWTRLIRLAGTDRERWFLAMLAADRRTVLEEEAYALLATDPSVRIRAEAVALTGLPPRHAVALTEDSNEGVRASACSPAWPALPAERRKALLDDEAAGVRKQALLRHHQDEPLSLEVYVREELGEHAVERCRLDPDLVEHLLESADARLRGVLAANPRLDAETVARLAADPDDEVRHAIAIRGDITEEQRTAICTDIGSGDGSRTLPWVAELHDDPEAMRRLAASSHLRVRRSVARARRLPPDVVRRLAWDPDRVVQLFLAESCDDAPAEMLLRVWTWWTGSLSSPGRPRTHPNFPREGLLRYADDPHGRMRRLALDDPLAPAELVARFARDRDPEVRGRAAEDPRLPAADAARMTEDPEDSVRGTVLRLRHLPASVLADRLRDPDTGWAAAHNPGIPPHVLRALAERALRDPQATV
ncbi:PE-PGRS family protein [Streptomyces sp. NPDC059533]|uniref:PE-PGRS family protein n=1 Tax=unclassified Streptomyces TaxID=2593676 RepID=UPI0036CC53F4